MRLSFRQGIVSYEQFQSPAIISLTAFGAETINLNVIEEPITLTFAHHNANYIVHENSSIVAAWGGGGVNNEPLVPGPTYYLYWDIDLATGALSRGRTTIPWISNSTAPLNPVAGQHWFDTVNTTMRVWKQVGLAPGYWQDVIRLFAAVFNGSTVVPYTVGSQVGITGSYDAGNIILGVNNAPLRQGDGSFVTTTSPLIIQQTSGQNVKFEAALVYGKAFEEIPAYYLVAVMSGGRIKLALSGDVASSVIGISTEALAEGEVGQITTHGIVRNSAWTWDDADIGKPLFRGPTGELWLTPPPGGVLQRVGEVYDNNAINLNIHSPVNLAADPDLIIPGKVLVLQSDGSVGLADANISGGGGGPEGPVEAADVSVAPITDWEELLTVQDALEYIAQNLPTFPIPATDVSIAPIAGLPFATDVQGALEDLNTKVSALGPSPEATCFGYSHLQAVPGTVWIINHGGNTTRAAVTIYDENAHQVMPDEIIVVDENTIIVEFNSPEVGSAIVVMFAEIHGPALDFLFATTTYLAEGTGDLSRASGIRATSVRHTRLTGIGTEIASLLPPDGYTAVNLVDTNVVVTVDGNAYYNVRKETLDGSQSVGASPVTAAGFGTEYADRVVIFPDDVHGSSVYLAAGTGLVYAVAEDLLSVVNPVKITAIGVDAGSTVQIGNTLNHALEMPDSRAYVERSLREYDGHLCLVTVGGIISDPGPSQYNAMLQSFSFNGTNFSPITPLKVDVAGAGPSRAIMTTDWTAIRSGTNILFFTYSAALGWEYRSTLDASTVETDFDIVEIVTADTGNGKLILKLRSSTIGMENEFTLVIAIPDVTDGTISSKVTLRSDLGDLILSQYDAPIYHNDYCFTRDINPNDGSQTTYTMYKLIGRVYNLRLPKLTITDSAAYTPIIIPL